MQLICPVHIVEAHIGQVGIEQRLLQQISRWVNPREVVQHFGLSVILPLWHKTAHIFGDGQVLAKSVATGELHIVGILLRCRVGALVGARAQKAAVQVLIFAQVTIDKL